MTKVKNYLLTLLLGIGGGVVAFTIINSFAKKQIEGTSEYEYAGPSFSNVSNSYQSEGSESSGNIDLRDAAKTSVPGVVHVTTIQMGREYLGDPFLYFFYGKTPESRNIQRETGFGSGVILSEDGYIVTNNHVIQGADKVKVVMNDKREFEAKVVGQDPGTDVALLKVEARNLPYIKYGDSDKLALGEWVLAVGNPYNLNSTVTAGIISAKARDLGMNRGQMRIESFLQTDAAINPGNSGGALVNTKGELVGINTLIQSPTGAFSGYAFAIPVNIVKKVVNDLKEYGNVQKGIIGIRMIELTPSVAERLGTSETSGIYVGAVMRGGAADKAGMEKEDVIKKMNGIPVATSPEFQEQLAKYNPGSKVIFTIIRNGEEKEITVVLQDNYGDEDINIKEY
ncbi:MAG: trypsin-like peptidase domain-containing protein [Culturomica sp.]|jgi:Do/DeqQ family serine protease|nr:trypsin-like peptidase domain-containing protein [Culturomica sp.]